MVSTTLKKITTRAKQIRKAHPSTSWISAVKKAGAEYRGGKISGTRKKKRTRPVKKRRISAAPKRTIVKTVRIRRTVGRAKSVGTAASHTQAAKKILEEQLAWKLLAISSAKKVRERNKLAKQARLLKAKLRGLSI